MSAPVVFVAGSVVFYTAAAALLIVDPVLQRRSARARRRQPPRGEGQIRSNTEFKRIERLSPERSDASMDRVDAAIVCTVLGSICLVAVALVW